MTSSSKAPMTQSNCVRILSLTVSLILFIVVLVLMNERSVNYWLPLEQKVKVQSSDMELSESRDKATVQFKASPTQAEQSSSDDSSKYGAGEKVVLQPNKTLQGIQPLRNGIELAQGQMERKQSKLYKLGKEQRTRPKSLNISSNSNGETVLKSERLQTDGPQEFPSGESKQASLKSEKKVESDVEKSKIDLPSLAEMLKSKIKLASVKEIKVGPNCASNDTIANSCDENKKKCLRMEMPQDMNSRVAQLVNPVKLQLTQDLHDVLRKMAKEVVGHYDVILLTAASSNHYFESQAMMKNVHENVFPMMKNFTFLFYNLGLSAEERQAMIKHCKCQVLDFPFEKFPDFIRQLSCFSWKPILIKAHVHQANVLIWADASIRFHKEPHHLKILIERTRRRGVQIGGSSNPSPFRTFRKMYHYFGDEPCVYLEMGQAKATIGLYASDPFVDRAILEPWVACAVHKECMCTNDPSVPLGKGCSESKKMAASYEYHNGSISYGLCHRFDQSAISLILHKLYQGYYRWVMVNVLDFVDFRRGDTSVSFPR